MCVCACVCCCAYCTPYISPMYLVTCFYFTCISFLHYRSGAANAASASGPPPIPPRVRRQVSEDHATQHSVAGPTPVPAPRRSVGQRSPSVQSTTAAASQPPANAASTNNELIGDRRVSCMYCRVYIVSYVVQTTPSLISLSSLSLSSLSLSLSLSLYFYYNSCLCVWTL